MELKTSINNMEADNITLDPETVTVESILSDDKYNILKVFLHEKNIHSSNDIKKMSLSDFNMLKMAIPNLNGVGEVRTNNYLNKLDEIRKNSFNNSLFEKNRINNINLGQFPISKNWNVEINYLDYGNDNEYIDIRQIKNDGTRGKGISIKKEMFSTFQKIVKEINIDSIVKSNHMITKSVNSENINEENNLKVKNNINNEDTKINTIADLIKDKKYTAKEICLLTNNNEKLGIYYNEIGKFLILKCQINDGINDKGLLCDNRKILYCMQNEPEENFKKLSFSIETNKMCKNIIMGYDCETKVYLFYRTKQNDDFVFAGEVLLERFESNNKLILISIKK